MGDTTVRDVGEFGLISALREALPEAVAAGPALALGIGDDAALWQPTTGEALAITTDSLVEGVHFRLDWTDWPSLGHKTLAVNLSDLAAMGTVPKLAVVTLGLRGSERLDDLVACYHGLGALAARYGVLVAGGDIVASPGATMLHVTAVGETRGGRALRRAGAKIGDLVAVSGTLGASAAGLRLLGGDNAELARATTADHLIAAHLRPEPRIALGALLLDAGASAAMDLSDGLLGDLPKLLAASNAAARLDAAALPIAAAVRALFPADWLDLATRGGEDYELLFTAPPSAFAAIQAAAPDLGATVTTIGEIAAPDSQAAAITLRGLDGIVSPVMPGAFDHFA
jgi:thiamine-monophosphate kinase